MSKPRADLGFGAELEDFDPEAWTPTRSRRSPGDAPDDQLREAATAAGFRSREPVAPSPASRDVPVRRRRTGRNTQFNIKAKPETIEAFCAVADAHGWGLGETLEHAVALLQRDMESRRDAKS